MINLQIYNAWVNGVAKTIAVRSGTPKENIGHRCQAFWGSPPDKLVIQGTAQFLDAGAEPPEGDEMCEGQPIEEQPPSEPTLLDG